MITVVIPALNEEELLRPSVVTVLAAAKAALISQIEIIIVNDGSTDNTAQVIRQLEKEHACITSIHHNQNLGIGRSFIDALTIAKYDKITIFPGDNYSTQYLIENLFRHFDQADFIISYTLNTEFRKKRRNVLSTLFCMIYMLAFDIHIKYINGSPVYPTKLLRRLKLYSTRYSVFAEINVKLLRSGVRYLEVAGYMNEDAKKSSAIKLRNLIEVIKTFLYLFYDVRIKNHHIYNKPSTRVIPKIIGTINGTEK